MPEVVPDTATLLRFVVTTVLLELTPGPNMAFLITLAAVQGRAAGLAMVAGVALGLSLIGLAAALGLATLAASQPVLMQALTLAGVAYLAWLAFEAWRDADAVEETGAGDSASRPASAWFGRGLVVNLLNPKAAVFYLTVLPAAIGTQAGTSDHDLGPVLVLTAIAVLIATAVHLAIVLLASSLHDAMADRRRLVIARRGMALALAGVAVWFGVTAL